MKKTLPFILIVIAVIAGYFFNAYILKEYKSSSAYSGEQSISQQYETLVVYPKKKELDDFKLWDMNENEFTKNQFENKWSLVFTGYTNCPDICPNTLNDLNHIYRNISPDLQQEFQFVFLSVDPNRDTPQRMKAYLDNFHEDFIGISGEKEMLDKFVYELGSVYKLNTNEGKHYSVDHSGRIFILDPAGRRFGILQADALIAENKKGVARELESLL